MRLLVIVVIAVFAQGCFWGFPPPRRPQSVPSIVDGEEMKYESSSYQTGVDGDSPTYGSYASATYRGRDLTQNEFSMLVDSDYVAKATTYDGLRSACFRGNVFKFLAAFTVIGGVVSYPSLEGRTDDTTRALVAGGLIAGGLALGAIGYFAGGNRCAAASELGISLGAERFDDTNLLGSSAGQREVDKFNERYGIKKAAPKESPTDEAPTDDPPADDAPTEDE